MGDVNNEEKRFHSNKNKVKFGFEDQKTIHLN